MKLSTRGRYGVRAMIDLALNAESGPQPIRAIAARQDIPEAYLEQLIASLKREGLVSSTRGAQGGYVLSRPPEQITVGDVLRTLEDGIDLVDCLDGECCEKRCSCASRKVWLKLREGMNRVIDGITLKDMIEDQQRPGAQEE